MYHVTYITEIYQTHSYIPIYRYVAINVVNFCYNMVHDTLGIVMTNHFNGIAKGVPGLACATLTYKPIMKLLK